MTKTGHTKVLNVRTVDESGGLSRTDRRQMSEIGRRNIGTHSASLFDGRFQGNNRAATRRLNMLCRHTYIRKYKLSSGRSIYDILAFISQFSVINPSSAPWSRTPVVWRLDLGHVNGMDGWLGSTFVASQSGDSIECSASATRLDKQDGVFITCDFVHHVSTETHTDSCSWFCKIHVLCLFYILA